MPTIKRKEPKAKIEKIFRFFYCTKNIVQPSLIPEGKDTIVTVSVGRGHVVYKGRLICGTSMEVIKNRAKADGSTIGDTLPRGIEMCPECNEGYKSNPESPWSRFVNGTAKA